MGHFVALLSHSLFNIVARRDVPFGAHLGLRDPVGVEGRQLMKQKLASA